MNREIVTFRMPETGKISLIVAPKNVMESLTSLLALLALRGRVHVIDGGNCFDAYGLSRALRKYTHRVHLALSNIHLSRVFTSYQMVTILSELSTEDAPVVLFDMLATFLDENVPFSKRQYLLTQSLTRLQQISVFVPVVLWAHSNIAASQHNQALLMQLFDTAQETWQLQPQLPQAGQLPLF